MQQQALSAIVSWVRLERAIDAFNLDLKKRFGLTGLQLSVLRICAERPQLPLAALRKALLAEAPLAGPARLREVDHDVARLDRLKLSLDDAIEMFGLGAWDPARKG